MLQRIQKRYNFTDYEIAQLHFFFLTLFSELSKFVIIGLFFMDDIRLYLWAIVVFQIVRSTTGGFHCKTYWSCLLTSLAYMLLVIKLLPFVPIHIFAQQFSLAICAVISYFIGPIISKLHLEISDKRMNFLKKKVAFIIFTYMVLMYIFPQNHFITIGYWVIILNTLQLIVADFMKRRNQS